MKWLFVILNLLIFTATHAQNDTVPKKPQLYRDKIVLYADHGFNAAPISINYPFSEEVKHVSFKHNIKPLMGFGVQYKWFGLRVGFSLKGQYRPVSRYGKSEYFDLGFRLNLKRTFWDIDFRNYKGYVIKDAYKWDDTLDALHPNLPMPNLNAYSLSINSWYFRSKDYRMSAVLGTNDEFDKTQKTWYFKSTFNIFGLGNNANPLAPISNIDSTDGRSRVKALSAIDLGLVPGYAYTKRYNYWQASAFGGLGGVIQAKWYAHDSITRGFIGLAPRIDLRFVAGYSHPKYFFWFTSDFDIKSIKQQKLVYVQTYYQLRLVAGVRLDKKSKKKKSKDN